MNPLGDEFYEKYGELWSSTDRRKMESLDTAYKVKTLCSLFGGLKPNRIVDFGCGLGEALDLLAKFFNVKEAIGIDISSTMLNYARKEYPQYRFIHGGIPELKATEEIDLVTFIDVLEHLEDIPGTLEAAKRNAKYIAIKIPLEKTWFIVLLNNLGLKDRKSIAYETEGHLYEFNQGDVEKILENAGLKILCSKATAWRLPREVLFAEEVKNRMRKKIGLVSRLKYLIYIMASFLPLKVIYPLFELYHGIDYFVLCQVNYKKPD